MNRADFLKRLGLGAIGIAVAPMVKADDDEDVLTSEEEDIIKREIKRSIEESPPAKVMLMDKGNNGRVYMIYKWRFPRCGER